MMSSSPAWTSEQDPVSGSSSPREESRHETERTPSVKIAFISARVNLSCENQCTSDYKIPHIPNTETCPT